MNQQFRDQELSVLAIKLSTSINHLALICHQLLEICEDLDQRIEEVEKRLEIRR